MAKPLTIFQNPEKAANTNSGIKALAVLKPTDSIMGGEPFSTLFAIKEKDLENICSNMAQNGFDNSQPLHVWREQDILIDGYTRLASAKKAGIKLVPVFEHSFDSVQVALDYAIHLQKDRRNLSDADLLSAISIFDSIKQKGERTEETGKSAQVTAEKLGVSVSTIERARAVERDASDEQKEQIKMGEKTINKVYTDIKKESAKKPADTANVDFEELDDQNQHKFAEADESFGGIDFADIEPEAEKESGVTRHYISEESHIRWQKIKNEIENEIELCDSPLLKTKMEIALDSALLVATTIWGGI